MKYLFNSKGKHIANESNNHLYSTRGKNIGHYLENYQIFIDMYGHYLGEIVYNNRLLFNRNSTYKNLNTGSRGNYGSIGSFGNPGNYGSMSLPSGYEDIDESLLN